MNGRRGGATLPERALIASAAQAGCEIEVMDSGRTGWSSATFSGARHVLVLAAPSAPALDRWLEALPEATLALRGEFVTDVTVTSINRAAGITSATVEMMTVDEAGERRR